MFGIIQPCRHALPPELRAQWWAHLCGLCLGLRDGHGQLARLTTNVDAVALSVLVEAQRPEPAGRRRAGPCPLRGFRPAEVVRADDRAVGHAVAVSLTMAATKVADHVADGDGWAGRLPVVPAAVAGRWARAGEQAAAGVGLDLDPLRASVAESSRREHRVGLSVELYAEPTEEAAAHVCRHTSVLAGRPANLDALDELGRMFGRTVYLVDAVRDLRDDRAAGRFNPLVAGGESRVTDERALARAEGLLVDAHRRITAAFESMDLPRPALARALFVDQVGRAGTAALRAAGRGGARGACAHAGAVVAGGIVMAALPAVTGPAGGTSRSWRDRIDGCCCCCDCGDICGTGCECGCDCCDCCECCDC